MRDFKFTGKEITPEDFKWVGYCYFFSYENPEGGYDDDCELEIQTEYESRAEETISALANQEARCSLCNHRIKRANFFVDKSGNLIAAGIDCSKDILHFSQSLEYSKSTSLAKRKKLEKARKLAEIFAMHPTLEADLQVYHKIILDIRQRLFDYAKISEKQVNFVHALAERRRKFEAKASKAVAGKNCEFEELEIVSAKVKIERYPDLSRYSTSEFSYEVKPVLTLKTNEGWLIYANMRKEFDFSFGKVFIQVKEENGIGGVVHKVDQKYIDLLDKYNIDYSEAFDGKAFFKYSLTPEEYAEAFKNYWQGKTLKNVKFSEIIVSNNDPYFSFGKRMSIK